MASPSELQAFMRDVPLFKGLLRSEIDRVAMVMRAVRFSAGDVVCTEGEPGHEFYVILEGEAVVERRGHAVGKLAHGDHFGELALLDRGPRSATVRALTDTRMYMLEEQSFAAVLNEVPALAQKLLAALSRRLREAEAKLDWDEVN